MTEAEKIQKPSDREVRRALKDYAIKDGVGYSIHSTILGGFTTPYALALGANAAVIGLLNALPKLAAMFVQPLADKEMTRTGNRKNFTTALAVLASIILIPLIILPFLFGQMLIEGAFALGFLILIIVLYQAIASAKATGWATWFGDLVPEKIRGKFFGHRGAIMGFAGLVTTLVAGFALQSFTNKLLGFSILFGVAAFTGLVSSFYMMKIPATPFKKDDRVLKFRSAIKSLRGLMSRDKVFANFTYFLMFSAFAVQIASPFFTVSMLEDFNMSYETFALILAIQSLATIATQPYWGRFADKYGDRSTLAICAFLIPFVPAFWIFVKQPMDMAIVLAFGGFVWAGFNLSSFNYLLDATDSKNRPDYIANHSILVGFANFAGPLVGGALALLASSYAVLGLVGLQVVFAVSFILRFIISAVYVPSLKELRVAKHVETEAIFWKAITVYPIRFFVHELMNAPHYMQHRPRIRSLVRR